MLQYSGAVRTNPTEVAASTAAECQGTAHVIDRYKKFAISTDKTDEVEESRTTCNMDTGEKRTLQKWSRDTWFCVSGGGHISMWQPLYQYVI